MNKKEKNTNVYEENMNFDTPIDEEQFNRQIEQDIEDIISGKLKCRSWAEIVKEKGYYV